VNASGILERTGVTKRRLKDWAPVLATLAICLALELGGDEWRRLGRYDRVALESGEYWRLVSAHFVHLGWAHLWPNLAALLIIGALFQDLLRGLDWVVAGLVSAAAIDTGLFLFDPGVQWYVGLSGVGLCAKLLYEQTVGAMPFSAGVGGAVIVAAHLYGAAGASVWAAIGHFVRRRSSRV